jgi:hypothetical protein
VSDLTAPPPEEEGGGRAVDEALAQDLVERARSEGVELVGPGGLLTDLDESAAALVRGAELGQAQRLSPFQHSATRHASVPSTRVWQGETTPRRAVVSPAGEARLRWLGLSEWSAC